MNSENKAPRVSIVLPYFPGFFESWLDSDLDSAMEQDAEWIGEPGNSELDPAPTAQEFTDAVYRVADWGKAHDMLAREWLEQFAHMIERETGLALGLEFEEVNSPREYNFRTDRIFATIPANVLRAMRSRVSPATWAATLADHFKSRSGFISFYPCEPEAYAGKDAGEFDCNEAMVLFDAFARDNLRVSSWASGPDEMVNDHIRDKMNSNGLFSDAMYTAAPMGVIESRIKEAREEEKELGA